MIKDKKVSYAIIKTNLQFLITISKLRNLFEERIKINFE